MNHSLRSVLVSSLVAISSILCSGLAQAEDVPVVDKPTPVFHYPQSNGPYCSLVVLQDGHAAVNGSVVGNTITAQAGSNLEVRYFCRYQFDKQVKTSAGVKYTIKANGPIGTYKGPAGGFQIGQESPSESHSGAELATGFAWRLTASDRTLNLGWDDGQGHSNTLNLTIQIKAAPATTSSVDYATSRANYAASTAELRLDPRFRLEFGLTSAFPGLTSGPTEKAAHGPMLAMHGMFGDGPTKFLVGARGALMFGHMPIGNSPTTPAQGFNGEIDHRMLRLNVEAGVHHQANEFFGAFLMAGVGPWFSFEDTAPVSAPDYVRQSTTHAAFGSQITGGLNIGYERVFFTPSLAWAVNWSKIPDQAGPEKVCSSPTATAGRDCFERKGANTHTALVNLAVTILF